MLPPIAGGSAGNSTGQGVADGELQALSGVLEAILISHHQPLSLERMKRAFAEEQRPSNAALRSALSHLGQQLNGRAVELVEVASGWRIQVRSRHSAAIARMTEEKPARYSRALLETLALIAYQQPITRGEIEQVRGVAVSSNIIRTLQERQWIKTVGHREVPGRPALWATTPEFLDYFNMTSLEQLPELPALKDPESLLNNAEAVDIAVDVAAQQPPDIGGTHDDNTATLTGSDSSSAPSVLDENLHD